MTLIYIPRTFCKCLYVRRLLLRLTHFILSILLYAQVMILCLGDKVFLALLLLRYGFV